MVDLSVIIVSWNVRDLLDKCLLSLRRARRSTQPGDHREFSMEIIVVDSASGDASAEMIRAKHRDVLLLPQSENIGFTRGNNIGLKQARGDYLLLLNPDTEVSCGALGLMIDYMKRHPQVGILGPHTLNSDGSHQSTRRRFPTLLTGLVESTWLATLAPQFVERKYRMLDTLDADISEADWVQGSALMLRRAVYAGIGGLDEGYIMYSEELDYCRRAKTAGWRVYYHGGAIITHHGGKSSEQVGASKQIHFQTSKLRYFRKHHGVAPYLLLRATLLLQFSWQLCLESLKGALGHKRDLRTQRVRAYWQVLRTGLKAQL
ncbi:MAG: glycosyltransferase family 2 protein [Chloroflexota bacterium]|nr:glycosyltransferase family 2 protein [Chloroflexota bacterium]MDE2909266.1 glycosyltransferase family 2 protein [Chloroflexota bacterium]